MPDQPLRNVSTGTPLGEISQEQPALDAFLDENQGKIITLAIILAIAAVGFVIFRGVKQGNEETAGALLTKAQNASELQSIVKNQAGTTAAFSAKILLAEKQWQDGQQDDAIATLKAFVESDRDHPARPSAEASLATKLSSQGKTDAAAELFHKITTDTSSQNLAPYAWISLGDIEASKGNLKAAEEAYDKVEADFPGSSFSQEAIARRLLVKAQPPLEIEAPAAPPETGAAPSLPDASVQDLLESVKDAASQPDGNPLLEEPKSAAPAE